MPQKRRPEANGYGVFLLFGLVLGLIIGLTLGEPSAGVAIGFSIGLMAAALLWWRRR